MNHSNLFLYDLAIVAVMKNEAPYLKEWLDYHLLAGVDHFYIYDNDSTDNQAEVANPYVEAGLVDYIPFHGNTIQYVVYNDAINRFKFQCRYMSFIDGDEFVYPKTNQSIVEVVDDIFSQYPLAASLGVNWQHYGSNGQETADYSRGVLERFIKRAPVDWTANQSGNLFYKTGNLSYKNIFNPRMIDFVPNCHKLAFLGGRWTITELGKQILTTHTPEISVQKIVVNHYHCKSWEEYAKKKPRGSVMFPNANKYSRERFDRFDRNEIDDDGILKYRAGREKIYQPHSHFPDKERIHSVTKAFLADGSFSLLEPLLVCLANACYLNSQELTELSLNAISDYLADKPSMLDLQIFIKNLPCFLQYPSGDNFKKVALDIIPRLMDHMHFKANWQRYSELDYIRRLLLFKE